MNSDRVGDFRNHVDVPVCVVCVVNKYRREHELDLNGEKFIQSGLGHDALEIAAVEAPQRAVS